VVGLAGRRESRPLDLDQGAFEAWLPREPARAAARNAAAAAGSRVLAIDAHATIEHDGPDVRAALYAVHGRTFRCDD
jgi:hypothetical protein